MPSTQTTLSASEAAGAYQAQQAQVSRAVALAAIGVWRNIDGKNLDASWAQLVARMVAVVAAAQLRAVEAGVTFLARILAAAGERPSGGQLVPAAFAGLTGDGRPLGSLLYTPVALSKQRIGGGERIADVLQAEEAHVAMLARTVTQDAGRMGMQSGMTAEPKIRGYVRQVHLPACARCIILAGRFYRYSDGFLRHPCCDCTMTPVAVGQDFVHGQDPDKLFAQAREQDPAKLRKSLTEGDFRALDHGANLNQVVNAHRGMSTAAGTTTEGTTRRGVAGKRLGGRPRLTPAQIFAEASASGWGRDEIVRQLTRAGYII